MSVDEMEQVRGPEREPVEVDLTLPEALERAVERRLESWREERFARRLWRHDPTLWASANDPDAPGPPPELADRLGWLGLPERALGDARDLTDFAERVRTDGFERVVLLGMGGSSLAPEVFQAVLGDAPGAAAGFPSLSLLDSTHPAAVRSLCESIDLRRTLFVVASKSGTTAETLSFFHYFHRAVEETLAGEPDGARPGERFVAITDPGSPLARLADERGFRRTFLAPPDVGGRYSALSVFGLVPAAMIGLDVERIARAAAALSRAPDSPLRRPGRENPGLRLAAAMAEAAISADGTGGTARDKLTFLAAPPLTALPDWIEQLVAESLGKDGRGIVPVVAEPRRGAGDYGPDRLFVRLALAQARGEEADSAGDEAVRALTDAGHPVVTVTLGDRWDLGAAMLLWEVATAAAGAALGVQPFDQPDVELAKRRAREVLADGSVASPDGPGRGVAGVEEVSAGEPERLREALRRWAVPTSTRPADAADAEDGGDATRPYAAVQTFLPPDPETDRAVRALRRTLAERLGIATTAGYGPRFLHSTGQLHKGGPPSGLFLQLVDPVDDDDVAIPGSDYGFGALVRAQAVGDYRALAERGRRVLRVRLDGDRGAALAALRAAVEAVG